MKTNSKKQYEKPCMDVIEMTTTCNLLAGSDLVTGEDPEFGED